MSNYLDFLPGRWLRARPRKAGLYARRDTTTEKPVVVYFDPRDDAWLPGQLEIAVRTEGVCIADPEWFYAPGDSPGYPALATDAARYTEAQRNGWKPWREPKRGNE